jgi:AcrR family transcriptional regulator
MATPQKNPKKAGSATKKKRGDHKPTFTELARRKQILDVSSKLFMANGFKNTSLDDIAREVGVSRGVIFYYFDGKREIGEQTIWEALRQYGEYVQDRVGRRKTSKNQLLEFIDACLDYQHDHRELYLLTVDLVGSFGDTHDRFKLTVFVNRRTREWLMDIIKAGQKNGEIGKVPARVLADVIQGFIDGLMEMTAMEPDVVNLMKCKKLIRKMVLQTIEP